jgi:hypothetical protein
MATATLLAGCNSLNWPVKKNQTSAGSLDITQNSNKAGPTTKQDQPHDRQTSGLPQRPIIIRQVSFDILKARVAQGGFSKSGKIWNHLDEEAIPANTAVYLLKNGLRVARGKLDSWRPIKALLEREKDIQSSPNSTPKNNAAALTINLGSQPRDQTLFMIRPDGYLAGATYPKSTNQLRIEYGFSLTDPKSVLVRVMPEIKMPYTNPKYEAGSAGLVEVPSYQPTRILHELAFQMELGPDEFFVIGPAGNVNNNHLAGALLLCEQIKGKMYESIYFITPKVHQRKGTPPNSGY